MATQAFMAYWLGYVEGGPTLEETPEQVGIVALAFAVTAPSPQGDSITLDFLTSKHSERRCARAQRRCRRAASRCSCRSTAPIPGRATPTGWGNLKPDEFAANVKRIVMDDWGLDGIDLDNEAAGNGGRRLLAVVKALRAALGPDASSRRRCSWGPERDGYLAQVKDDLDSS